MLGVLLGLLLGLLVLGFTVEELPHVMRQRRVKRERLQRERADQVERVAEGLRKLAQAQELGQLSRGERARFHSLSAAFMASGVTIGTPPRRRAERDPPPPPPPRDRHI